MLKDKLQADLKTAMLARDTEKVEVLKGLKSAILYVEVEQGKREEGLSDDEVLSVFKKESKKRQDSVDLYKKGGNQEMSDKEASEKAVIDAYLPTQLTPEQLNEMIDDAMASMSISEVTSQDMGKIIGAVKAKGGAEIDGGTLAGLVKSRMAQ